MLQIKRQIFLKKFVVCVCVIFLINSRQAGAYSGIFTRHCRLVNGVSCPQTLSCRVLLFVNLIGICLIFAIFVDAILHLLWVCFGLLAIFLLCFFFFISTIWLNANWPRFYHKFLAAVCDFFAFLVFSLLLVTSSFVVVVWL